MIQLPPCRRVAQVDTERLLLPGCAHTAHCTRKPNRLVIKGSHAGGCIEPAKEGPMREALRRARRTARAPARLRVARPEARRGLRPARLTRAAVGYPDADHGIEADLTQDAPAWDSRFASPTVRAGHRDDRARELDVASAGGLRRRSPGRSGPTARSSSTCGVRLRRLDGDRDPGQRRTAAEPRGRPLTIRGARGRVRRIFDLAGERPPLHRLRARERRRGAARRGLGEEASPRRSVPEHAAVSSPSHTAGTRRGARSRVRSHGGEGAFRGDRSPAPTPGPRMA